MLNVTNDVSCRGRNHGGVFFISKSDQRPRVRKKKKEIEPIHVQPKNAPFPKWTLTLGFCAIGKDRIQIYSWVKRWS